MIKVTVNQCSIDLTKVIFEIQPVDRRTHRMNGSYRAYYMHYFLIILLAFVGEYHTLFE